MQKALTQMNIQLANVISDQKGEALSVSSFAFAMMFEFFRARTSKAEVPSLCELRRGRFYRS